MRLTGRERSIVASCVGLADFQFVGLGPVALTQTPSNDKTFWTTTGMFPQEMIVTFPAMMKLASVEVRAAGGE
jgi:hypothetical protein